MTNTCKIYQDALKLLAKRPYSRQRLQQKLVEKGHEQSKVEEEIERLDRESLLREDLYIDARVRGLMRKNLGPLLIQKKLKEEGIHCSLGEIREIFRENGITEAQQQQAILKKMAINPTAGDSSFKNLQLLARAQRKLHSKGHFVKDLSALQYMTE